jgi:hypothetical protein
MKRGGAAGMNIEVAHSLRHGGKDMLIEEEVARLNSCEPARLLVSGSR